MAAGDLVRADPLLLELSRFTGDRRLLDLTVLELDHGLVRVQIAALLHVYAHVAAERPHAGLEVEPRGLGLGMVCFHFDIALRDYDVCEVDDVLLVVDIGGLGIEKDLLLSCGILLSGARAEGKHRECERGRNAQARAGKSHGHPILASRDCPSSWP